jgi:hypothetical protein
MLKRAFWLGLVLIATQLSAGCWCGCHRPYLFRRCCWQPAGCGFAGGCGCGETTPVATDYSAPPLAPSGTMPPATPLTRR